SNLNPRHFQPSYTNLPLVSSTYDLAASAYASTKENHPYVKVVLDLAEKGVKHVSDIAVSGAQPLLSKLEPQVAAASHYASKGLDKLEEKLPILHQTADQVDCNLLTIFSYVPSIYLILLLEYCSSCVPELWGTNSQQLG
uniref:Perilipin 1 n=1 Tax=Podarcis muralis TaxID=64176 RepID=A0A670KG67_PODMU